jgi:energy-coupling factor transport system ATP-binding protein
VQLVFNNVSYTRGIFSMAADGTFTHGTHLVSGIVGSGKSTFALLSAGFIRPFSGSVTREGIQRVVLSMQFPEYHVTGITLDDEIRSWGLDIPVTLETARLGARGGDDIAALSRGELKRLHIACVLSVETDLLVLDEPFSALDCCEKKIISEKINSRKHGIVILCTHEHLWLPEVDYIWEIKEGVLRSRGRVPEAIARWEMAPKNIRDLTGRGITPWNVSPRAIMEALCRTPE